MVQPTLVVVEWIEESINKKRLTEVVIVHI